jgi:hypothetical protein
MHSQIETFISKEIGGRELNQTFRGLWDAKTVMRGENGDVVPLSERFYPKTTDIRFRPTAFTPPAKPEAQTPYVATPIDPNFRPSSPRGEAVYNKYDVETAGGQASLASEQVRPSDDASEALAYAIGGRVKTSQTTNLRKAFAQTILPQFTNFSSKLGQIGRGLVNQYDAMRQDVKNRQGQLWVDSTEFLREKSTKDIVRNAKLTQKATIEDANGQAHRDMRRDHVASFYGYAKQARLPELVDAHNRGGNAGVAEAIDRIAEAEGIDSEDSARIKRQLESQAYALMGEDYREVRLGKYTPDGVERPREDQGKVVRHKARDAEGNIAYDPNRETVWRLRNPPGGLAGKVRGKQTTQLVMNARTMVDTHDRADQSLRDFYDNVYRHVSDDILLPALKTEWERSHPNTEFMDLVSDHLPLIREFDRQTKAGKRVDMVEDELSKEQAESIPSGGSFDRMERDSTVREILLDNYRGVQSRGTSQSDMVLYGLGELMMKQRMEVGGYQSNSFAMNWSKAISDNESSLKDAFGERWVRTLG